MKLKIIPIGNSKGIRIPASILNQCKMQSAVDMKVKDGKIILEPVEKTIRDGWKKAFTKMAQNNDDNLVIGDELDLDSGDWEW